MWKSKELNSVNFLVFYDLLKMILLIFEMIEQ